MEVSFVSFSLLFFILFGLKLIPKMWRIGGARIFKQKEIDIEENQDRKPKDDTALSSQTLFGSDSSLDFLCSDLNRVGTNEKCSFHYQIMIG